MLDYREGTKGAALCENCETKAPTTLTNETISLCEGLEEIENVLALICDQFGSICAIPYKSVKPVQDAVARFIVTKTVSNYGKITIELKSQADARKERGKKSEPDFQDEYHA